MRRPGFEPGSPAWQASIIPLDQRRLVERDLEMFFACNDKVFNRNSCNLEKDPTDSLNVSFIYFLNFFPRRATVTYLPWTFYSFLTSALLEGC